MPDSRPTWQHKHALQQHQLIVDRPQPAAEIDKGTMSQNFQHLFLFWLVSGDKFIQDLEDILEAVDTISEMRPSTDF
jgi:hypothetical protein